MTLWLFTDRSWHRVEWDRVVYTGIGVGIEIYVDGGLEIYIIQ